MDTHDTTVKLAWEAPATVALTDTDSRADQTHDVERMRERVKLAWRLGRRCRTAR